MAKRKRLTPANPMFLEPAPETKSAVSVPSRAPIADVAREASATAAAEELARQRDQDRAEGRMVIAVSLSEIRRDHLTRDRIPTVDEEEMTALVESLRARGQQTPVDLVDLYPNRDGPRYGLISGWRRCLALERLQALADADAAEAQAAREGQAHWLHHQLQRGDPARVFEGPGFHER